MQPLPRFFNLVVHLDGNDVPTPAEAFQHAAIQEPEPFGADRTVRGGGMDSNCLIPRPPVMSVMKVTLPDGRKGTFKPRIGDGKAGLIGMLVAD